MTDGTGDTVNHYERLLAPVYLWMIGGLRGAMARNRALFERHGIRAQSETARALDVGSGPGPQSLALAELGYRVTAIDPSQTLIDQLRTSARERGLPVEAVRDGVPLGERHPGPFDVITCMTDTLVSLPARETARHFLADAMRRLTPGGRLLLSWRDLTELPTGDARFLPVRSDPDRIITCILEPVDEDHVRIHDLLHERDHEGFTQRISSYLKLRLSERTVDEWLTDAGFTIATRDIDRGMHLRIARRPST